MTNKLRINKKTAVNECKIMWKNITDNNASSKFEWLNSEAGQFWKQSHDFDSHCPLCEYVSQFNNHILNHSIPVNGNCVHCPLVKKFGKDCHALGYHLLGDPVPFANVVKQL